MKLKKFNELNVQKNIKKDKGVAPKDSPKQKKELKGKKKDGNSCKKFNEYHEVFIAENLDLNSYFKDIWSKDENVINKIKNTPSLKGWKPYLDLDDDEWKSMSRDSLKTLWQKWDEN